MEGVENEISAILFRHRRNFPLQSLTFSDNADIWECLRLFTTSW